MDKEKQIEEMANIPTKEEIEARNKIGKEKDELRQALLHYATAEASGGIKSLIDCEGCAFYLYEMLGYRKLPEDSVSTSKAKVFDILNKFEFFQGQRAGRELWNDKPKEVQDKDIADFVKGINYIRDYLKDRVVLSREEYEKLTYNVRNDIAVDIIRAIFETLDWSKHTNSFEKGILKLISEYSIDLEIEEQARKETATEIITYLHKRRIIGEYELQKMAEKYSVELGE